MLTKLRQEQYLKNLCEDGFILRLTFYFSEINYIHPFREGNGRATREFIRELMHYNGYEIDWGKVSVNDLLEAMIESVYGTGSLERVLKVCITKR